MFKIYPESRKSAYSNAINQNKKILIDLKVGKELIIEFRRDDD